jgi:hypothetical protein
MRRCDKALIVLTRQLLGIIEMNLEKAGGFAAIVEAIAYIVGFAAMASVFNAGDVSHWTPVQKLAFLLDRQALFQLWNIGIYVVFGIALVVLAAALNETLKTKAPAMMQVATALGLIWAGLVIASGMLASVGIAATAKLFISESDQAVMLWRVISIVQDGLGGGVEVVGGLWLMLVSTAGLRSHQLSRALNWLGLAVGFAGVLTIVPPLAELASVFGLGQIVWFGWIGMVLLSKSRLPKC